MSDTSHQDAIRFEQQMIALGKLKELIDRGEPLLRSISESLAKIANPLVEVREAEPATPATPGPLTSIGAIAQRTADFYGVTLGSLRARSRAARIVKIRKLAMIACRHYTDGSLAEIGREFNRNHPAVSNAWNTRGALSEDLHRLGQHLDRLGFKPRGKHRY